MLLTPGQMIHNRYRIITLVSPGGMSAVYEALDLTLNVRYAIKEMMPYPGTPGTALPDLREQFRQEAQLLAELRHPNLPRVIDHFEEDSNAYLVMDFIYGQRLDEIIKQQGKLDEKEVLNWARQLMEALNECHSHGIIHRDVKPHNVIITPEGQPILVDFGLAKLVDPNNPRTRTIMRGLGTPEYAPPEQYDVKKGRTDPRTDIYSLGATLYHALSGVPPPILAERVVNPTSLIPLKQIRSDVSQTTANAIMKTMALQPSKRFQSIDEMHKALFDAPSPKPKISYIISNALGKSPPDQSLATTVLLPWKEQQGIHVDRRVGVTLAIISLALLAAITTLIVDRIQAWGNAMDLATATPTALIAAASPTSSPPASLSPTVTSTPTYTPTSTATARSPDYRATMTLEALNLLRTPISSPTPTQIDISPTPTRTPIPPTYTPTPTPTPTPTSRPEPQEPRHQPRPTSTRTPTPIPPTNTPVTPSPTPTEKPPTETPPPPTQRPTLPPQSMGP